MEHSFPVDFAVARIRMLAAVVVALLLTLLI
jgi:hypothetical protein